MKCSDYFSFREKHSVKSALIALLFFGCLAPVFSQTTQTFIASGIFTVPANVTTVTVECWGAGGAGGGIPGGGFGGGGGGGGGAYSRSDIIVTPGLNYTVTVGVGGFGNPFDGAIGGDSWFNTISTILAAGGNGGIAANFGNLGAAPRPSGQSIGSIIFTGGGGGNGSISPGGGGGGGGSSAGRTISGNFGGLGTPGTGGPGGVAPSGGGNGGNGNYPGVGFPGFSPGGGGGGAGEPPSTAGGNGANGLVIITFTSPTITTFTPTSAGSGTTVTITGTNFTGATAVSFGGTPATSFTVVSATSITAVVASGTSGNVVVTIPGATATIAGFTFIPAPTITTFTPTSAGTGTTVTITGTNFSATPASNTVYFGATKAMVTAATATQLTVTVPTGATYQPISVTVNALTAYSSAPFIVTFPGGGVFDVNSFLAKVDFTTGTNPYDAAIGDVDGDGKSDLVAVNYTSGTVSVFRNTSASGFITASSFASKVDFTTGTYPWDVAIGDVDGDGKLDLVIANSGSNTVSVFRNTSASGSITASSFASKVDFTTGTSPQGAAIGDVDGDGKPDLAVSNYYSNTVSVFRNTSASGSITASSFASKVDFTTGTYPIFPAIADFDGDGKPDLVVTNRSNNTVSVLRNTSASGSITASSFASKVDFITGASPRGPAIGDVDGDGKPDFVVSNEYSNTVSVFRNISTPGSITSSSFASKVDFATGIGSWSAAIGDVDGDGKPDLVVANYNPNTVSVLRNAIVTPPPTITNFSPTSGPVGTSVTITGTNFSASAANNTVMFNGTTATVTTSTSTSITTSVPSGATTGAITVTVGGQTATSSTNFSFIPAPTITSFTPTSAARGATVTITGTNFTGATAVTFGGTAATSFTVVSATSITAVVGAGTTGSVSVTTPGGTVTIAGFTSIPTPTISSFTPNSGVIGTSVTITGSNFDPAPTSNIVYFGATRAIVTAGTPTQLTVTVPTGATYQPITVTVNGLTAYSSTPFIVTFSGGGVIDVNSFSAKVNFTAGTSPNSVAIADLDGDGKPDLVVANAGSNTVSLFRNTSATGAITASSFNAKVDFAAGTNPNYVAIGDLDGDGKPDLAVANSVSYTVSVFRNTTTTGMFTATSFSSKVDFTTGSDPNFVAIGDLDGDGKPELVITTNPNAVSVFRNTSTTGEITTSSFAAKVDFTAGTTPFSVAIGDLDGDGKPELAVANAFSISLSVFKNTTTSGVITASSFASKVDFNTGISPYSVAIGDLDGDGKPELAVANYGANTVSVFKNTTATGVITVSSFAGKVDFATGSGPCCVAIGDLNGDGKPDLGVANTGSATVSVFKNTSITGPITASSFTARVDFATGTIPRSLAIGDLDGDGKPDLVACNDEATNSTISVLRNIIAGSFTPTITSFTPASGPIGTSVTITGSNFDPAPTSNIVYFGATRAIVTAGTPTQLTVTVPTGATYQPITVTVNGLTAYSSAPFIVTFPGGGVIDVNTFLPKVDFTTGTIPGDVTIGDVDGDGKPDLAVLNNNLVSVSRNTSVTGLITLSSFETKVDFGAALYPNGVAFGDLNGDGKPDLAISSVTEAQVSVLRNTSVSGSVLFASRVGYYGPGVGIAIGDLNGDGKPDLATGNNSDNTVSVLRNISVSGSITSSSFAARVDFPTESVPFAVAIGDLDGDGKPDLAVAANGGNAVSVLRNTTVSGPITFASKVDYITGGTPRSVAIGDLDGDGKQDLVVANYGTNSVSVLRNTSVSGSIAFASGINFTTGTGPDNVAIGDLDGDGKPDLALANLSSNTVSVFRNTSVSGFITSSSFASKVDFTTATGLQGVAIGDVDGDGKPDLVITNGSNAVSVFRNQIGEEPTITNFAPTSGVIGATVTITGTNFSTTAANNTVMFNGTTATVSSSTATSIATSVPVGTTTGQISVTVNGNTGTSSTNFTILIPPTWHVSTAGNDTNAGTSSAPLRNIQTAITKASAGDIIKVASGTFTENLISQNVVLRGGYDATFADVNRNLFINKTILKPSTGTVITDNGGSVVDGFMVDGRSGATKGIIVAAGHSTVTHNAVFGFLNSGGVGIQVSSGASAVVKNNSIANNKLTGGGVIFYALYILGDLNSATVVQNNITSNNDVGVHIGPPGVLPGYNCTFNNTYGNYSGANGAADPDDIIADPRIVDPANGDFRLKGSSPCIDAGNPSDPIGDEPSPNGNRIDIGAYGGTTSATPAGSNPTTYVAISGNNSNDGSISAPYGTIQKALSSALGDTVKVASGTYNEGLATGSKVILLGGYTTSFKNADRNIFSNKTIILGVSTIMLYDTKGSTIDGFIFDGNSVPTDAGIKVEVGSVVTHNIVMRVNQSFAAGIEVNGGAQVLNNTIRSCAYGIEIKGGTGAPSIKNNIVASNTWGIVTSAFNSSVRKYNDVYGNSFNYTGSDSNPGTGDISLDPLFKDAAVATLDLRILSTSPCVNAGDPGDFVGEEPPPNGGRIDMGAYGGTKIAPFADVPNITGFNPTSGPVGTSVIISGTNFSTTASNNTVKFNNTVANVTSSTAASITTTVPAGATTGAITVTVGGQTATSSTNFTVTVVTPPTITSFNPTSGPVGTSVIISGTNFSTTLTSNTVKFNNTTATVTASTATSITASVPTGATTGAITITVGGQTATSSTNFTVTTASSPTISGFNPTSGNVGTSVSITGTNFSITITNNTVKFNGTTATVTASTATSITASVPTGATTGAITVTVGGQTATSAANFTVTTTSTTVQITNESFMTTYDKGATLTTSITVNDASKVSIVNFKSRGISEASSALKSVAVTAAGNKFEKVVLASELTDPIGIVYSFEVIDKTPSQGVVNSTIGKAYVKYPAASADQVLPALSFGNQVSNYQIIAVPLELTNKSVSSVFASLMPYDKTKWRLFDYASNDNREYSAFSTIDAGKGYWLIVKTSTTINPGEGKTVQADDAAPFAINLSTGWNLIGNPYNFRVSWTDVLLANSNPAGVNATLKVFSGGTLTDGTILEKYRGAFVFSSNAVSVKIPVTRNTSLGGRVNEEMDIVNSLDQNHWEVKLMLRDGPLGNELGGIGMHPNATLKGKDPFDEVSVPLPEGLNLFELAYPHPEVFTYFNKEVVPTQENYRWDFEVKRSLPTRNLELSWKNDYFGDNEKQLFLFDPTTLQITDMRKVNRITLTTATNNLSVLYGGPEYIQHALDSDLPWLGYPYPNPAKEELTIPFRVPERQDQMPVKISILNGTGVEVATPVNRTLGKGNYDVKWYPQGESGLYLIRMKIGQQETKAMKVIIK